MKLNSVDNFAQCGSDIFCRWRKVPFISLSLKLEIPLKMIPNWCWNKPYEMSSLINCCLDRSWFPDPTDCDQIFAWNSPSDVSRFPFLHWSAVSELLSASCKPRLTEKYCREIDWKSTDVLRWSWSRVSRTYSQLLPFWRSLPRGI